MELHYFFNLKRGFHENNLISNMTVEFICLYFG